MRARYPAATAPPEGPPVDATRATTVPDFACVAIVFAGALVALWPALGALYFGDDYYFVDLSRAASSPLDFFVHGHFFTGYLYRPLPLGLWWLVDRVGTEPGWHYAANALLLGWCGTSLFLVAKEYGSSRWLSLALALLFVCHPISVNTALWLSDIFDLVATGALLSTLWALSRFVRSGAWKWWWAALALFAAAAVSKELAYIGPAVFAIYIRFERGRDDVERDRARRAAQIGFVAASAAVVVAVLVLRWVAGVQTGMGYAEGPWPAVIAQGILSWFGNLPRLLLYGRLPELPGALVLVLFAALIGALGYFATKLGCAGGPCRSVRLPLAVGTAIALSCTIVQSPHTSAYQVLLLGSEGAPSGYFYERFFFLAFSGVLLIVASAVNVATAAPRTRRRRPGWSAWICTAVGLGLAGVALARSYASAGAWAQATTDSVPARLFQKAVEVARRETAARTPRPGVCVLMFRESGNAVFRAYAEPAIKALARNPAIDECVILTEDEPLYSMASTPAWALYRPIASASARARPVRFRQWLMMLRGTYTLALAPDDPIVFTYSASQDAFVPAPG